MMKIVTFKVFPNFLLFFYFLFSSFNSHSQKIGIFEGNSDIGNIDRKGSVQFDEKKQEYIIEGSGENMWFDKDEFHYLWKHIEGDFILRARIEFIGEGVDAHRKIGWIVRKSLEPNSPHVNACTHGDGLTSLQFRNIQGGDTEEIKSKIITPEILQLERRGNIYIMSAANFENKDFETVLTENDLGNKVYVGLYVCSHNIEVSEKAKFRDVQIIIPGNTKYK